MVVSELVPVAKHSRDSFQTSGASSRPRCPCERTLQDTHSERLLVVGLLVVGLLVVGLLVVGLLVVGLLDLDLEALVLLLAIPGLRNQQLDQALKTAAEVALVLDFVQSPSPQKFREKKWWNKKLYNCCKHIASENDIFLVHTVRADHSRWRAEDEL